MVQLWNIFAFVLRCLDSLISDWEKGDGELLFSYSLTQTKLTGQQLSSEIDVCSLRGLRICWQGIQHVTQIYSISRTTLLLHFLGQLLGSIQNRLPLIWKTVTQHVDSTSEFCFTWTEPEATAQRADKNNTGSGYFSSECNQSDL